MSQQKFHQLFKKYRLRSEFESLAEFGKSLASEGFIYEDSIFTYWQNGKRIPRDRATLLAVLTLFIKRGGISSLEEANEFLESAGQGYLTTKEINNLPELPETSPFLAPQKPNMLLTREELLEETITALKEHKIILLHGQAGIGKSVLAIELAHRLKQEFPDGVLWYRTDSTPINDILDLIGDQYNKTVNHIQDIYAKASVIRSYLSKKKILYILDNAETNQDIDLLLPNASNSAVILTSQFTNYNFLEPKQIITLQRLSEQESLKLFEIIVSKEYMEQNKKNLRKLTRLLGNIPLAIQITAKQIASHNFTIDEIISLAEPQNIDLKNFKYENKDLYTSIQLCFQRLDDHLKTVFLSLAAFHGPDFSLEAVSYINDLTIVSTKKAMNELINYSLVEHSTNQRYRMHPFIMYYLSKIFINTSILEKAADYYAQQIHNLLGNKIRNELILQDQGNIIGVVEKCYFHKKYISICKIIDRFGVFLWETGQWERLRYFTKIAYESAIKANDYENQMLLCNRDFVWIYFWNGQVDKAEKYILKGLELAKQQNSLYHINFSKLRLVRVYLARQKIKEAKELINEALEYFMQVKDFYRLSTAYRFFVEINLLEKKYDEAKENIKKSINFLERTKIEKFIITYKTFNYTSLGTIYFFERKYAKAKKILNECLAVEKEVNSLTRNRIIIHTILGLIAERQNHILKAKEQFSQAEKVSKELGIKDGFKRVSPILMSVNSFVNNIGVKQLL